MVKSRNILMTLKAENEDNVIIIKTIYNARQIDRLIEKGSRSQM